MLRLIGWFLALTVNGHDGKEATDRLVPPGWTGNPWGPVATEARRTGEIPPIRVSPLMNQWDRWGRSVLKDGDIVFRRGDARILFGRFPFSRFVANCSASQYSHTGIVAIEKDGPVVYDITKAGVRRQPFCVWILDNVGPIGVKRLKPDVQNKVPAILTFCRSNYKEQTPFDYELGLDDSAFYCVEMTEKAYRSAGLVLSEPIRLGDMDRASEFPICIFTIQALSAWALEEPLTLEHRVYFPGNDHNGIWASPYLQTVYPVPATATAAKPADRKTM
jgi:hypothetical protein